MLDLFGVAENINSLLVNSMEKWTVMLCSGNSELDEVEIKGGIFQGDSLSPLVFVLALIPLSLILRKAKAAYEFSESKQKINHPLFVDDLKLYSRSEKGLDSLVQTVRAFSEDIGMEFGIEKCAILVVYVHGSEERLIQAARGDKIDGLEAASALKRSKKKVRRLREESSTWPVFEADQRSKK